MRLSTVTKVPWTFMLNALVFWLVLNFIWLGVSGYALYWLIGGATSVYADLRADAFSGRLVNAGRRRLQRKRFADIAGCRCQDRLGRGAATDLHRPASFKFPDLTCVPHEFGEDADTATLIRRGLKELAS